MSTCKYVSGAITSCVIFYALLAPAKAQTCNISVERKGQIKAALCKTAEENLTGESCLTRALDRRLESLATSTILLRLCGDQDLADQLTETVLIRLKSIYEPLSFCFSENVNVIAQHRHSLKRVEQMPFAQQRCNAQIYASMQERRLKVAALIAAQKQKNDSPALFYNEHRIRVDSFGNVLDK
jgi:hypothetical protein